MLLFLLEKDTSSLLSCSQTKELSLFSILNRESLLLEVKDRGGEGPLSNHVKEYKGLPFSNS